MLKLENVRKKYGSFELQTSLQVAPGQITGLIGENGAGKSTTFKAILNLISIDGGEIRVMGKHPWELTAKDKEEIGVVLPDSGFSDYLRVKDVTAVLKKFYTTFDENSFLDVCHHMGLPMDKKISEFSTGMKAKLKLAVAMSHNVKLLVLDEPTAGLDVVARDEILEELQRYMEQHEDCSILISSHISTDLEKICDDLYMMHKGNTILHEETDVLLSDYAILKVDEEVYPSLEKEYLLCRKRETYGYSVLTDKRQFFLENYPGMVVEKSSIDEVITMMVKGERV